MTTYGTAQRLRGGSVMLLILVSATACSSRSSDLPQVSEDGLELVEVRGIQAAYVKPGSSLAQYNKVILDPVAVEFAADFDPVNPTTRNRLSDAEKQDIKDGAAQLFLESFRKELTDHGYEIVSAPAADVLRLTPALVNLYVTAPDNRSAATRTVTYTMDPGRVTLVAELRDSQSGDIIARVFDAEAARETATFRMASRVQNASEARTIFGGWARTLRERLDAARGVD